MEQELPHPSRSDIRLDQVDGGRWRVTDRRFRETHPRTLLGFIDRVDGGFEAVDLRHASESVFCADLDAAIDEFLPTTALLPSLVDVDPGRH